MAADAVIAIPRSHPVTHMAARIAPAMAACPAMTRHFPEDGRRRNDRYAWRSGITSALTR